MERPANGAADAAEAPEKSPETKEGVDQSAVKDVADAALARAAAEKAEAEARGRLSVDAPAFVPGLPAAPVEEDADLLTRLPMHHRSMLRGCYQAMTGEFVAYYVGSLKSYNNKTGYGFLECQQANTDWGGDVFVHKNQIGTRWTVGQPVEFAVSCNNRGQPQAFDCVFLPPLPQTRVVNPAPGVLLRQPQAAPAALAPAAGSTEASGGYATAQPPVAPDSASGAARTPDSPSKELTIEEQELNEPRRLGTLKSFSPSQGYGFISCDEIQQAYQRDVYLDKSQLPTATSWRFGQCLEFAVSFNARGHPQARRVNWEPVPLTAVSDPSSSTIPSWQRNYSMQTVEKLKRLLRLLHEKTVETAVVTAIDLQGGSGGAAPGKPEEVDTEVDYVIFVLDRLSCEEEVLKNIKDFVKMLFILMLSKMLRTQTRKDRTEHLIKWFQALSSTIKVSSESVKQHFQDVVAQINNHLKHASSENAHLADEALAQSLQAALGLLKEKAEGRLG